MFLIPYRQSLIKENSVQIKFQNRETHENLKLHILLKCYIQCFLKKNPVQTILKLNFFLIFSAYCVPYPKREPLYYIQMCDITCNPTVNVVLFAFEVWSLELLNHQEQRHECIFQMAKLQLLFSRFFSSKWVFVC